MLDTNTLVSALLFQHGRLTWLRGLWTGTHIVPLASRETTDELLRVLAYPKFDLDASEMEALVSDYLVYAELVRIDKKRCALLPQCRDENDQVFLELAHCGNAQVLVTGDQDLLDCADKVAFAVQSPAQFKKRFG